MNMKRVITGLIALLLAFALVGCAAQADPKPADTPVALRVIALKGPTGMGMARLMDQAESGELENFDLTFALTSAPDDVVGQVVAGDVDVAAVPINLASALYNKTEGDVVLLAINTLGVLYVLENGSEIQSIGDLAGKTLYATGQASTPEYILNYLLEKNGLTDQVTVEYKAEHSELATLMASGEVTLGMLPEPNVTAVTLKNQDVRVALDLTEEWNKVCDTQLVQGCIIMRRSVFEDEAVQKALPAFLDAYAASADYTATNPQEAAALIEKYEIMASAAAAQKALPNCNIVCMRGQEMKDTASAMLEVLFNANPKSVGGALPGDDLYYVG